jgi:membrane protease YdiL (CAAX protease family)
MKVLKLVLSILGVLILHQALVLAYTIGVSVVYGTNNAEGIADGSITDAMVFDAVMLQAANSLIFAGVAMIGVLWLIGFSKRESFRQHYRFSTKPSMIQLFIAITIGFSALFFSSYIVRGLAFIFPQAYLDYVAAFENLQLGSALSFFIAVVIMAPLFEEVLFRGWMFNQIQRTLSVGPAVVVSGVMFGVFHLNIFQGTFATVLGIVLGLSLLWTNSIWVPITIHLVNNGLSWLLGLDAISQRIESLGVYFELGSIFFAFVLFPAAIYTLYTEKTPFVLHQNVPKLDTIALEDHA